MCGGTHHEGDERQAQSLPVLPLQHAQTSPPHNLHIPDISSNTWQHKICKHQRKRARKNEWLPPSYADNEVHVCFNYLNLPLKDGKRVSLARNIQAIMGYLVYFRERSVRLGAVEKDLYSSVIHHSIPRLSVIHHSIPHPSVIHHSIPHPSVLHHST